VNDDTLCNPGVLLSVVHLRPPEIRDIVVIIDSHLMFHTYNTIVCACVKASPIHKCFIVLVSTLRYAYNVYASTLSEHASSTQFPCHIVEVKQIAYVRVECTKGAVLPEGRSVV